MSPFALLGPFQSRNNLFRPRFSSIYLKWKFFNYLTFFGIFFKIFVLWGLLDVYHLEFRENPTFSEFNEFDWVTRFREMNSTMKSVSSSEI